MQPLVQENVVQFPFQEAHAGKIQCRHCHGWIDDDALFCCRCGNKQVPASKRPRYAPQKKQTKVPLKSQDEIAAWQRAIGTPKHDSPAQKRCAYRNFVLFTVGISIGLRVSDLVQLKLDNFASDRMYIIEKKTQKGREIMLTQGLRDMVFKYANAVGIHAGDYLFPVYGRKTPMSAQNVNDHIIRDTAVKLGLDPTLYGSHTMRKTYAYQFYKTANEISKERGYRALSILCKELNHSSEAITLRYIGIDEEEIAEIRGLTINQYNLDYDEDEDE